MKRPAREQRKVFYVADDRDSVVLFKAMLAGQPDVSLFPAGTAEDGIFVAFRERPDFVFLDINLPGMDGITALGILRADPRPAAGAGTAVDRCA